MRKITLLILFVLVTTFGFGQNLISNGSFDDATGWTITNHYEATNTNGTVTISGGVVTFDETTSSDWKHMGIYTSVVLNPGTYQFDMDMAYTGINQCWGEVYVGASVPVQNTDYGDNQVLKAYNSWECGATTYSGLATASGCDGNTNPGEFEITSAGTYYVLFRTGGQTYGTTGIVIDNMTLIDTTPAPGTDASLSDLQVEGMTISGFASGVTSYTYELPYGTTTVPTVTVTTTEAGATPVITPASGIPGDTTIVVTAQDGTTQLTYTVSFSDTIPNVDATDPTYTQVEVEALYSDSFTAPGNPDYNPGWSQATVMTEEVINGNNTLKYAGLNYQGITFDAMDVSDRDYLHFDYWTAEGTQFRASPISSSTGEVAYIISTATQNQWVSVDVPLSYFTGINAGFSFTDIYQFKFDTEAFDGNGQGAGNNSLGFSIATFYVDNVYFHSGTLGVNNFVIEGLKLFPNPTNNSWNISTQDQVIKAIEVYNILGRQVLAANPDAISTQVDATGLATGIYLARIKTDLGSETRKLIKN